MSRKSTIAVLFSSIALAGCGVKTGTSPAAVPAAAPLSGAQQSQEKARVIQAIQEMTPEQRAAYFKANPGDAAVLAP